MSTRSLIGIFNEDESVTYIYCHWNGYPSHNGKLLLNHYMNVDVVNKLMELGDLSYLAENLNCDSGKHSFKTPVEGVCVAYGRDRGESGTKCKKVNNYKEYLTAYNHIDYFYLFNPTSNKWNVNNKNGMFSELTLEMCK